MTDPLLSELNKHEIFKAKLLEAFPDTDEETLADTLEGMTDLTEMIAATLRSAQEDRALADGLGEYIGELVARAGRINDRAKKKRILCLDAMERANITKLTEPDFTAGLRSVPQSVRIIDEAKIPTMFFEPQPDRLDKRKLLAAMKDNPNIEGVVLNNPAKTISIRTK